MPSKSRSASVGPAASSPSASSPSISRPSSAKTVQTQATAGKAGTAKTAQVQAQVDEVINIMHTNVEKVIMRGEKLEDLQSKTADLKQGAIQFRKGAAKVKAQMWYKDLKMKIIIVIIVLAASAIIIIPIAMNLHLM